MAIEKKLICFARLEEFERQLAAGNILDYSIVFIQDAKKIWNRGTYYDCSTLTESTISEWGFTKNTGTYSKPNGGIPKSDLASAVQTSLGKADTALQSYTEQYKGTVTGVKMNGASKGTSGVVDLGNVVTSVKINGLGKTPSSGVVDLGTVITEHQDISGKQDKLVSGTNIKTINNQSIVGSGNITISGSGEANVQSDWNVTDTSSDAYIKNKPTIPAAVTESTVSGWGFTKNTGTYSKPSTGIPKTDLSGEVQTALNKASSALQAESFRGTVTKVKINGSEKAPDSSGVVDLGSVVTDVSGKQDALVSGTNIKTINGTSILGSGDITIEGGSGSVTDVQVDGTSVVNSGVATIRKATVALYGVTKLSTSVSSTSNETVPTSGTIKRVNDLANGKQDALVSGTNIKTINGESILGSGNITISGGGVSQDYVDNAIANAITTTLNTAV